MWYVAANIDGEVERWECLTKGQAVWVCMNKMSGKAEIGMMQ